MLNLPNIYTANPEGSTYYLAGTKPLDIVRIHVHCLLDGSVVPILFVGNEVFRLDSLHQVVNYV